MNEKKILYIIIIGLLVIVGILFFRGCGNDYDSKAGFTRIIEYSRWFAAGIRSAGSHISAAIDYNKQLEENNIRSENRIKELESRIDEYSAEFDRIISEYESGITAGTAAINRARTKTDRIRTAIERLLQTTAPKND